ncbi:MAG: hypothetical protein ACE5J4_01085 [Candidatus Aenigmatarchaeota archaeon]
MKYILITLVAIVLVLGCIGGEEAPTPVEGKGLEIIEFAADQSEVYSGRSVRITMEVENQGGYKTENETSLVYLIGSNLNLDDTTGFSWNATSEDETLYKYFNKDMDPADPARDIPADRKRFSWRLNAPILPQGQSRTDDFIGRIYYEYKTTARGTVWVYSESEYEAARTSGKEIKKSTFTPTQGTISIEVSVSPDPPVLIEGEDTFTMSIKLSNIGGGTIYDRGAIDYETPYLGLTIDDLNWVNVDVESNDLIVTGCTGDQEMVGGRDTTLVCDVTLTPPATVKGYSADITVSYGYYKDSTISVTALGR